MKTILFNTDMVHALQAGSKTMTRRVVKPQPKERPALKMCADDVWRLEWWNINKFHSIKVPYCPGDILYVRETFQVDYLSNIPGTGRIHSQNVSFAEAWKIVKHSLDDESVSTKSKVLAIEQIAEMETHNSITKNDLVNALRWLFAHYDFEE